MVIYVIISFQLFFASLSSATLLIIVNVNYFKSVMIKYVGNPYFKYIFQQTKYFKSSCFFFGNFVFVTEVFSVMLTSSAYSFGKSVLYRLKFVRFAFDLFKIIFTWQKRRRTTCFILKKYTTFLTVRLSLSTLYLKNLLSVSLIQWS